MADDRNNYTKVYNSLCNLSQGHPGPVKVDNLIKYL